LLLFQRIPERRNLLNLSSGQLQLLTTSHSVLSQIWAHDTIENAPGVVLAIGLQRQKHIRLAIPQRQLASLPLQSFRFNENHRTGNSNTISGKIESVNKPKTKSSSNNMKLQLLKLSAYASLVAKSATK